MNLWINGLTLILGLCAWFLPLVGLVRGRRWRSLMQGSLACCALSLLLVILHLNCLVLWGDLSALLDTMSALCAAAALLTGVTLLLNALLCAVRGRAKRA